MGGFAETMTAVARWKRWFREHSDVLTQVYSTADIHHAKRNDKVGVILGWQNTSGFGDYLLSCRCSKSWGSVSCS